MIPRLVDDGSIRAGIAALRPREVVDETPSGRMAGIEGDTWRVYAEMYELLTGGVTALGTAVYEELLRDLTETLNDLHKRGEQGCAPGATQIHPTGAAPDVRDGTGSKEVMAARYPPDGDVQRWVAEGPTGHVVSLRQGRPRLTRKPNYPEGAV